MKKYVYENAVVYITVPTEAQLTNIRNATEEFAHKLAQKGQIDNVRKRRSIRHTGSASKIARRGN